MSLRDKLERSALRLEVERAVRAGFGTFSEIRSRVIAELPFYPGERDVDRALQWLRRRGVVSFMGSPRRWRHEVSGGEA